MSEEKLYMVENDEGKYLDMNMGPGWNIDSGTAITNTYEVLVWANNHGGHVITLIKEPEKVVLSKEQAKIVKNAHDEDFPATYISDSANLSAIGEEELLMKAYVNGYTMAKEKKYLVYKKLGGKHTADVQYAQAYLTSVHSKILWILTSWILTGEDTDESFFQFTESEIEHYGLQDCERVESD